MQAILSTLEKKAKWLRGLSDSWARTWLQQGSGKVKTKAAWLSECSKDDLAGQEQQAFARESACFSLGNGPDPDRSLCQVLVWACQAEVTPQHSQASLSAFAPALSD